MAYGILMINHVTKWDAHPSSAVNWELINASPEMGKLVHLQTN